MERTTDNVTVLYVETVAYEDGAECPVCGLARMWRTDDRGRTVCGTGEESGRVMSPSDPCSNCRAEAKAMAEAETEAWS